ncbi:CubicO group peptidase (beta-lactamase class C family) [Paenibacillus shirakamiensis]|uniref:CubicO group peptidase (Beta-lactamase class C family) n=1 Tax=Paenibacillus shirakamiensis TaxID=1265935 RepID=A0ABS4JKS1_9BACL|nr:CubicO group peptidase (beta-lactamase class C family) [Paenibacillus shirakamiensis]
MNANKYGYFWWLGQEEDERVTFLAVGDGGHVICCIPELDVVVAIASEFIPSPRDRWILIKDYIIPAIVD